MVGPRGPPGPASGYVSGTLPTGTSGLQVPIWYNDTGAPRVFTGLYLFPFDDVTQSDTDYWALGFVLGATHTVYRQSITTQTTMSGGEAIATGATIAFAGTVTVPAGDWLLIRRSVGAGSPTTLGFGGQGK